MYDYVRWIFEKKRLENEIHELNLKMEYRQIEIGDSNLNHHRGDRPHGDSDPVYTSLALQRENLDNRLEYLMTFGVLMEDAVKADGE